MKNLRLSIFILIIFAIYTVAEAAPNISKGPYVIFNSAGQRVVKAQSDESKLFLEYELQAGKINAESMIKIHGGIFERGLPTKAVRYRLKSGGSATRWRELRRLPVKGEKYRIVIYGDNRTGDGSRKVHRKLVNLMKQEDAQFVASTGDLVGKGGREQQWADFFEDIDPLTDQTPYIAAKGNHDRSTVGWFSRYFRAKGDDAYMSFPFGGGLVLILNSIIPVSQFDKQYRFLMETLEDSVGNWPIIVLLHEPPYSAGKHGSHRGLIEKWVPLFEDYGVNLVLGGHDHNYQRIGPINNILYLVTGGGGAPIYKVKKTQEVKSYYDGHHYVLLEIDGKKIRGWMKSEKGEVLDQFEVDYTAKTVPSGKQE